MIHFQMGSNWSIYHGKFTVELGVFVPEVYEAFKQKAPPKRVASYQCEERQRLGVLSENGKDLWWDLSGDAWAIGSEVLHWILAFGEPYFSQFSSRARLADIWEQDRNQKKLPDRKILALAILLAHSGDRSRAREILEIEFGDRHQTAFLQYARNIMTALGMDFPSLKS